MTLTKADIVEKLTEDLGFARHQAKQITESLLEVIKSTLESGDDVLVSGFGKFCVNEKGERRGVIPVLVMT